MIVVKPAVLSTEEAPAIMPLVPVKRSPSGRRIP